MTLDLPLILESLDQTCIASPSQWEGKTTQGIRVYVRFRWGQLSLDLNGIMVYCQQTSDGIDGFMDVLTMLSLLHAFIAISSDTNMDSSEFSL